MALALPFTLVAKLARIGYGGDFSTIGLSVDEALILTDDSLLRFINGSDGVTIATFEPTATNPPVLAQNVNVANGTVATYSAADEAANVALDALN